MAEKITEVCVFGVEMLCDTDGCGGDMRFINHQTTPKQKGEPVLYTHCCSKCNVVKQFAKTYPGIMHFPVGNELPAEFATAHNEALEREAIRREGRH